MAAMNAGMCRDCAFLPGSPEREPGSGGLAAEGGSIVDLLHWRLREDLNPAPFFCHVGATCNTRDGWRYVMAVPPGAQLRICAGWLAEQERVLAAKGAA